MTFMGNSYGKWNKVEEPAFVPISYGGSCDEEEVVDHEMVLGYNNVNLEYNEVSDDLDSKEKENLYDQRINEELEETPKKILNPKIWRVITNLKASYNNNKNKIIKWAKQEKAVSESLNFACQGLSNHRRWAKEF